MSNIGAALGMLFQVDVLIALIIGVVGGLILGAIPGINSSMGVALLVSVTYGMSPIAGLVMLTALYAAATYGGSITATLCHTPGTTASAATAIDGYALTCKGRGLEAVGVATVASVIGGVIGALALIFIAPPLGRFSMKFSCLEYFLVACFGLSVLATLAGENMYKGLFSGVLGVLLGTVGMDTMNGRLRFTFGILSLEDGIEFVPALIGLFSVSQVMSIAYDVYKGRGTITEENIDYGKRLLPPWKEFKGTIPTIIRSSIIGVIIGIIPAAGSGISSWVNYSLGKRFSKHPEEFGKGSFEGVAASETGNNAACGGALIPLITLGLPGSSVAAILLGGMMIHGLQPGNKMFTEFASTTYAIMIGYLVANVLMGVIGLLTARKMAKVANVPLSVLAPLIIGFAIIGSFSLRKNVFDVVVMVVFGLIGFIMKKTGFATAPVVLGLVLSNILENNWRRAVIMSRGNMLKYLFSRPISVVLLVLVIISLLTPVVTGIIKKRKAQKEEATN